MDGNGSSGQIVSMNKYFGFESMESDYEEDIPNFLGFDSCHFGPGHRLR